MIYIKTIGIILREFTENNKNFIGTRLDLITTLNKFNLNIMAIPITNKITNILNILKLCNGIILPGGNKDTKNDYLIVKYLYENDIPTLGICQGMQTMVLILF